MELDRESKQKQSWRHHFPEKNENKCYPFCIQLFHWNKEKKKQTNKEKQTDWKIENLNKEKRKKERKKREKKGKY